MCIGCASHRSKVTKMEKFSNSASSKRFKDCRAFSVASFTNRSIRFCGSSWNENIGNPSCSDNFSRCMTFAIRIRAYSYEWFPTSAKKISNRFPDIFRTELVFQQLSSNSLEDSSSSSFGILMSIEWIPGSPESLARPTLLEFVAS